ncbi:hypothetical protein KIW84_035231 [Lathyrus oleraceus]|uniref:Uncharacterized protein n=1 Tax=Pisum sativum TaxID=3888 RepID=A0A9D5B0H1_PEA|nr:hypothetical protein KIW84_035231 [Pisum sativum]
MPRPVNNNFHMSNGMPTALNSQPQPDSFRASGVKRPASFAFASISSSEPSTSPLPPPTGNLHTVFNHGQTSARTKPYQTSTGSASALLDLTVEIFDNVDEFVKPTVILCQPCEKTKSPIKLYSDAKAPEELALPNNRSPVTLFGRARLGLQDVGLSRVPCNILPVNVPLQTDSSDARQECLDATAEVKRE